MRGLFLGMRLDGEHEGRWRGKKREADQLLGLFDWL